MTINIADNSPRISYSVAAGVTQTTFAVPFEFFSNSDLQVYVDGTLQTLGSDYTVTGGSGATGSISMSVTGASGGSTVVITRSVPIERTSDFPTSGPFQITALNTELDRLIAIAADIFDKSDRALQLTDYDADVSLVLPDVANRKGKTLAFNEINGAVEAGPSIADTQSVAAASADIALLADIQDGTVATNTLTTLGPISANISTVAGISGNVTTVAGVSSKVTTVADNISDVTSVADNMAEVLLADTNAAAAAVSATAAASSASSAASSATSASGSASSASTSATNAAASASSASTSATNASTSATSAASSATSASNSASAAATSATNAATSETNAAGSATAAAASQVAAAASAASAANSYDLFDDRYLGSKTSDPTLDNDGNALVQGALYFNSTANEMRVYDGANWIAASSAGGASLLNYNYTATAGQTTFSGADDNAATLSYTQQNLIVTLNGIVLEDGTDYTASNGTSIVLTTAAAAGDELNIVAFKSFTTADMVPASTGGTFSAPVTVNGNNATVLTVDRATSGGTLVDFKKDGASVGSIGSNAGYLHIGSPVDTEAFIGMGGGQVYPATSVGDYRDAAVTLGASNARFKDLYLSGGVYLGGTGAANLLDDYEEGVWTPTVSSGSIASVNSATYTKVGNTVSFQVDMALGGTRGTEAFQVGGLPFLNGSSRWTACPMYHGAPISTYQQVMAVVSQGSSYLVFNGMGTNVPANQFSNLYIAIAGTYMTN